MPTKKQTFWVGVQTPDGKFVKMPVNGLWVFKRKDFIENDDLIEVKRYNKLISVEIKDKKSTLVSGNI